jgi:hypothetical protein
VFGFSLKFQHLERFLADRVLAVARHEARDGLQQFLDPFGIVRDRGRADHFPVVCVQTLEPGHRHGKSRLEPFGHGSDQGTFFFEVAHPGHVQPGGVNTDVTANHAGRIQHRIKLGVLQHSGEEALAAHGADQIHDGGRIFIVMNFDLILMRAVGLLNATHGFEGAGDFADGLGGTEAFDA